MMPELGKYAAAVLSAYGVTFVILAGIVALSLIAGRRARAELDAVEQRNRKR
jgi:heme exporter protein D